MLWRRSQPGHNITPPCLLDYFKSTTDIQVAILRQHQPDSCANAHTHSVRFLENNIREMSEPALKKAKVECQSCAGQVGALAEDQVEARASAFPLWTFDKTPAPCMVRQFVAKNFQSAMDFMVRAGELAEASKHHPDFHLTSYRNIEIRLYTHKVNGLTPIDFDLAEKLDQIQVTYSPKWLKEHPAAASTAAASSGAVVLVQPQPLNYFNQKTVLVTGCSRGLGLGFVKCLIDAGANVIASCRDPANAAALQELLCTEVEGSAFPMVVPLDVSSWDSIDSAVKEVDARS